MESLSIVTAEKTAERKAAALVTANLAKLRLLGKGKLRVSILPTDDPTIFEAALKKALAENQLAHVSFVVAIKNNVAAQAQEAPPSETMPTDEDSIVNELLKTDAGTDAASAQNATLHGAKDQTLNDAPVLPPVAPCPPAKKTPPAGKKAPEHSTTDSAAILLKKMRERPRNT